MKTVSLILAAAAVLLSPDVLAAHVQEAEKVVGLDVHACQPPVYPAAALAQRAEGKSTIEVQIGTAGQVSDARVATSSGRADLDAAALTSIRRCVFHAVVATGQTPTGWLTAQYVWVVDGSSRAASRQPALFEQTKVLAAGGDAAAQNKLGNWALQGTWGAADVVQAVAWYLLAARSDNADAQNSLGTLYARGAGVTKDAKQAADWYAKAAAQGHGWGQANLGLSYLYGSAGELDVDKAILWLTKAAEGGLAPAQVRLGLLSMQRAATDAERVAAAAWLARAAAQDFPPGVYYLGRSFELGLGNVQNDAQAVTLYRKGLTHSEGRAETALGTLIEAGRAGRPDQEEAARLYQKGTQWRHPDAYYHYGLVLQLRGDNELAAAVFREGAELGSCDATVKYVQVRQVAGSTPAAGSDDARWTRRAQSCAGHLALAPQL